MTFQVNRLQLLSGSNCIFLKCSYIKGYRDFSYYIIQLNDLMGVRETEFNEIIK